MMKLINGENEFELFEVPNAKFAIAQSEPYPMEYIISREGIAGPSARVTINEYIYRSIVIDGKFYGFKLIEKQKEVWQP